ncbi:glycosyltransferase family protein [Bacteroides cellulosilyticus]|jgi:hypothetical protein|uniref:hypothetical protein n=1 Tax=Bacteroides cellulosilyticus TaxID=246787 RepID=UPI001D0864F2|nr:hypothetical protein [Bacteroides cellulosilyticus]MCB6594810.1 hypothetical protein [Bacteroides cellulosilyticus]
MQYVLVTYNVCNHGGGQLYVLRRANYLREHGYDVRIIVCFDDGDFILEKEFSPYFILYVPDFARRFAYYSKSESKNIVRNVITKLGIVSDVIIESHIAYLGVWAEAMALDLHCKHICYPLSSLKRKYYLVEHKMLEYKYENNEYWGHTSLAIETMLGEKNKNNYVNIGFNENELVEKSLPQIPYLYNKNDFVISTISRLDKLYIVPLILSVCKLAKKYPLQNFVLIIAGGSRTVGREEFLFNHYNDRNLNLNNLRLIYTGYIIKLGRDFFRSSNVFVGMGTASINAISQKCLTLNIDPFSQKCSGFFGTDTNVFSCPENGQTFPIEEKLEEAYNMSLSDKNVIVNRGRLLFETDFEMNACFYKLDEAIQKMNVSKNPDLLQCPLIYHYYIKILYDIDACWKKIRKKIICKSRYRTAKY